MGLLKIWTGLLGAAAMALYGWGTLSGTFNRSLGLLYWGTSAEAMILLLAAVLCLLLCVTCVAVLAALSSVKTDAGET